MDTTDQVIHFDDEQWALLQRLITRLTGGTADDGSTDATLILNKMMDALDNTVGRLSEFEMNRLAQVLSNIPVVGLPNYGFGAKPTTATELIDAVSVVGDALGEALREKESLIERLRTTDDDLRAAGRILRRMGV